MTDKINISIPKELKQKIEKKIKKTNFKSIQEYVLYILERIVSENTREKNQRKNQIYTKEEETDIAGDPKMIKALQPYSSKEEKDLKKNLEDLGYL